jgi:tetratricopeptide (TPR) repeat protein
VDVSGGVGRFRHRRGELQRLELEVNAATLEGWAARQLRGLVSRDAPSVWVRVGSASATVCVSADVDASEATEERVAGPCLAFDVHILADEDIELVASNARGAGLPAPATALAIGCLQAVLGPLWMRSGAVFTLKRPAAAIARALLPAAGARVPSSAGVRWAQVASVENTWVLQASRGISAAPTSEAVRSRQIAEYIRHGDEALVDGDPERARFAYLSALEHAPKHFEIVRRIAEIDSRTPGREEAALSTLSETAPDRAQDGTEAVSFALLRGELLAATGDPKGATASFEHAAETEPAPALSSRAFELAAAVAADDHDANHWLDRALLQTPRSTTARWARVVARLALSRTEDALADVAHLEALAHGPASKYAVWMRAGRAWRAAGLQSQAIPIFERALRYAPDNTDALAGLGAALVAAGGAARGVTLLTRALELARARNEAGAPVALMLARALAEHLDDSPTAIAHVSTIASSDSEAPIARGLEGRWRASLGDIVGASLAFARLRELALTLSPPIYTRKSAAGGADTRIATIVALLVEAGLFERDRRGDLSACQRYLSLALRLSPYDADARRTQREAGNLLSRAERGQTAPPFEAAEAAGPDPAEHAAEVRIALDGLEAAETEADAEASARAEELSRKLHADPADAAAADELASLLEKLGRGHELLALLSARMEDAPPDQREALTPRVRAALERLAASADTAGRPQEAALYRASMDRLTAPQTAKTS